MANWTDSLPSKYLKASDFPTPKLLTIRAFTIESLGTDKRPAVWFMELERPLILNKTNGKSIQNITGSADTDRWAGHKVVLFATETDFAGDRVTCVRVRAPRQAPVQTTMTMQSPQPLPQTFKQQAQPQQQVVEEEPPPADQMQGELPF